MPKKERTCSCLQHKVLKRKFKKRCRARKVRKSKKSAAKEKPDFTNNRDRYQPDGIWKPTVIMSVAGLDMTAGLAQSEGGPTLVDPPELPHSG